MGEAAIGLRRAVLYLGAAMRHSKARMAHAKSYEARAVQTNTGKQVYDNPMPKRRVPRGSPQGRAGKHVVVLVTCGSRAEAQRIAREIVSQRLAACANLLGIPVQSVYRWKGKVEKAREFLLLIKTSSARLAALEAEVKHLHSYDVPEFIALPILAASRAYLRWLDDCVSPGHIF